MSQCRICFGAGHVSGLKLLLYEKAEKERLRRSKNISGPDLSKHFWDGLVSRLDLSCGQTCSKTSGLDVSKSFRAGSVSRLEVFKSLGTEVSHGRTWLVTGSVLELKIQPYFK